MVCGIDPVGLDILFFLIHRRVSWDQFEKIWRRRTDDLEGKVRDLERRGLVIRTRDGRKRIIAMIDNAGSVNILIDHDKIPPAHHRHPTRLNLC
jgi:hypothetical protein